MPRRTARPERRCFAPDKTGCIPIVTRAARAAPGRSVGDGLARRSQTWTQSSESVVTARREQLSAAEKLSAAVSRVLLHRRKARDGVVGGVSVVLSRRVGTVVATDLERETTVSAALRHRQDSGVYKRKELKTHEELRHDHSQCSGSSCLVSCSLCRPVDSRRLFGGIHTASCSLCTTTALYRMGGPIARVTSGVEGRCMMRDMWI